MENIISIDVPRGGRENFPSGLGSPVSSGSGSPEPEKVRDIIII